MKIFKITTLYKLIYIGVILLLLMSFLTQEDSNSFTIGDLSVKELSTKNYPYIPKKIKSVEISYKGIVFYISKKNPILLISDDNLKRKTTVNEIKINQNNNSLILSLENQLELIVRVDNNGQRLTVASSIPKVFPTIKELVIPYHLQNNYNIAESDLSYKFSNNEDEFHLKLNDKYNMDFEKNLIHIFSEDDKISTLTFSPLSDSDLPIAEQWYMLNRLSLDFDLDEEINSYLSKVDRYLKSIFSPIKFVPESDNWQNIPRSSTFTENGVIVYLAQSMLNGNYLNNLNKIKALNNRYPSTFGFQSTPFLGNIVDNGEAGIKAKEKTLVDIQRLIRTSDSKIFDTWIPDYYFKEKSIDTKTLEKLINEKDKKGLSLQSLGNTLHSLLNILVVEEAKTLSNNSIKEITDLILQKIKWDDTGIYLAEKDSITDQELNLKIGQLLLEATQHETSEYTKPIAEGLVRTYIKNSDTNGFVKKTYNVASKSFSNTDILPEDSFLNLSKNPHIPHYYFSNGISVWTVADYVNITKTTNEIRISMSYTYDNNSLINSHFLTITGVTPYKQLYFKGRLWRADKFFERYGVGYYYDNTTQLLYFMPNHSKEKEEILITY